MDDLKVPNTIYHRVLNTMSILLLIGMGISVICTWGKMPEQIPAHYDFSGNVDRWGSKGELLILPIWTLVMYIGMTMAERRPKIWNTGVVITEKNKERVYRELKNLLVTTKFVMIGIFSYMGYVQITQSHLGPYFSLVSLGVTFGSIVFFCIRIFRVPPSEKE